MVSLMPSTDVLYFIIFTRYPLPGTTKTRLIPVLGSLQAARLQRAMTEHLLSRVRPLMDREEISVEIWFEGGDATLMRRWLGPEYGYTPQGSGDLGSRMQRAMEAAFQSGARAAVIMGTDVPGITTDILTQTRNLIRRERMVIGPAKDGGYYLIGFRRDMFQEGSARFFTGIEWGTHQVFKKTLALAAEAGTRPAVLPVLQDIDRPEDLRAWKGPIGHWASKPVRERISVVIPTLNEADNLEKTLAAAGRGADIETIVVDGGSRDGTPSLAAAAGARVITAPPPKACQMNRGAQAATGDILLFLHADTRLPRSFARDIQACMKMPGVSAGAFSLGIDARRPGFRLIEFFTNRRSVIFRMPYGDQGIFVSAGMFHKLGGFPQMPLMEDYELVRRLRKTGRIVILPAAVRTSPRRWLNRGLFKTWLLNQMVIAGYHMGASPAALSRLYDRPRGLSTLS